MDRNQTYLGDGAYVEDNGFDFELWTMRAGVKHSVFLDQYAAHRFMEFVAMKRKLMLIVKPMANEQRPPDETI